MERAVPVHDLKGSGLDVIRTGGNDGQDSVVQLMVAEFHMLTPMVPTRESYFARYCKKLAAEKWAVVDVSLDKADADVDASPPVRCWKNPSGCIVEEQINGHSMVTWVEYARCREPAVLSMYRAATASGLAFGARRWVGTLQLQCERMVFSVETNVPTRDSNGVSTLAGRRSVLKLAHRMTSRLCRSIGGSHDLAWSRVPEAGGAGDIQLTSRKNAGDPGEPHGLIACAVLSTWLPWDVMAPGPSVQSRVNLAKGKHRGNCVTVYASFSGNLLTYNSIVHDVPVKSMAHHCCFSECQALAPGEERSGKWIVAYAPVDATALQPVIGGHDSSGVAVLPCGFAVVPDGLESRPAVITSRRPKEGKATEEGSLVTVAFPALASSSPVATLSPDLVETVTSLVSCTFRNIKRALRCEDR